MLCLSFPSPCLPPFWNILCIDLFYVQGNIFLTTISRNLRFRTVALLLTRSKSSILKELSLVIQLYRSRGFSIPDIHCDNEFACLANDLSPIQLNITTKDDHVGEVERSIRTIKERIRTTIHGLPFRRIPQLMLKELVFASVKWLNLFPAVDGISKTMSPYTIMTGRPGPDFQTLKIGRASCRERV